MHYKQYLNRKNTVTIILIIAMAWYFKLLPLDILQAQETIIIHADPSGSPTSFTYSEYGTLNYRVTTIDYIVPSWKEAKVRTYRVKITDMNNEEVSFNFELVGIPPGLHETTDVYGVIPEQEWERDNVRYLRMSDRAIISSNLGTEEASIKIHANREGQNKIVDIDSIGAYTICEFNEYNYYTLGMSCAIAPRYFILTSRQPEYVILDKDNIPIIRVQQRKISKNKAQIKVYILSDVLKPLNKNKKEYRPFLRYIPKGFSESEIPVVGPKTISLEYFPNLQAFLGRRPVLKLEDGGLIGESTQEYVDLISGKSVTVPEGQLWRFTYIESTSTQNEPDFRFRCWDGKLVEDLGMCTNPLRPEKDILKCSGGDYVGFFSTNKDSCVRVPKLDGKCVFHDPILGDTTAGRYNPEKEQCELDRETICEPGYSHIEGTTTCQMFIGDDLKRVYYPDFDVCEKRSGSKYYICYKHTPDECDDIDDSYKSWRCKKDYCESIGKTYLIGDECALVPRQDVVCASYDNYDAEKANCNHNTILTTTVCSKLQSMFDNSRNICYTKPKPNKEVSDQEPILIPPKGGAYDGITKPVVTPVDTTEQESGGEDIWSNFTPILLVFVAFILFFLFARKN